MQDVNDTLESEIKSLTDSYESAIESRVSELKNAFSLFEEFTSSSENGQTLLFNLQSQAAGYEAWSDALDTLEERGILSDELLEELTEMGPEELAAIYALTDLTDEELTAYQEAYDRKMDAISKQAAEENAELLSETQSQTEALIAQAEKDKADLLAEYKADVESVNTTISSELLTLADNATKIAEDQTTALVNAIDGGVSQITALLNASTSSASSAGTAAAESGVSGSSSSSSGSSSSSSSSASTTDAILDAIYSGPVVTTLTSAQRKKQSDLYLYLVDNYGHGGSTSVFKKLASLLGVSIAGSKLTSAEKTKVLKKLKAKGYRSGGKIGDELEWLDEELDSIGGELIVRKSDNAILTRVKPGDEVIDASTTRNLLRLSQIDPDELMGLLEKQQAASLAAIQQLGGRDQYTEQQKAASLYLQDLNAYAGAQLNQLASSVPDTPSQYDMARMQEALSDMQDTLEEYLPYLAARQYLMMDSGKVVGEIADDMSAELARRSRRTR